MTKITMMRPTIVRAFEAKTLMDLFKREAPKNFLDVGAGDGVFFHYLRPFISISFSIGADASISELKIAKEKNCYDTLVVCKGGDLPFRDKSVDFILCNSVLEHIPNPPEVLQEWGRLLSRKGKAWFALPLKQYGQNLFGHQIFGKNYSNFVNRLFFHFNMYTPDEWVSAASDAGLSTLEQGKYLSLAMTWAHEFAIPFFALAKVTKRILGRWVVFPAFRALFWPYFRALGVFLIDNGKNKSEGWFLLGLEGKSR